MYHFISRQQIIRTRYNSRPLRLRYTMSSTRSGIIFSICRSPGPLTRHKYEVFRHSSTLYTAGKLIIQRCPVDEYQTYSNQIDNGYNAMLEISTRIVGIMMMAYPNLVSSPVFTIYNIMLSITAYVWAKSLYGHVSQLSAPYHYFLCVIVISYRRFRPLRRRYRQKHMDEVMEISANVSVPIVEYTVHCTHVRYLGSASTRAYT